jgi:hypothetical protein
VLGRVIYLVGQGRSAHVRRYARAYKTRTALRSDDKGGAIMMFEPSGTSTTGDRHEGEIPAYVDSTAGQDL